MIGVFWLSQDFWWVRHDELNFLILLLIDQSKPSNSSDWPIKNGHQISTDFSRSQIVDLLLFKINSTQRQTGFMGKPQYSIFTWFSNIKNIHNTTIGDINYVIYIMELDSVYCISSSGSIHQNIWFEILRIADFRSNLRHKVTYTVSKYNILNQMVC